MRTYVSGSTVIFGKASFSFMSRFVMLRQLRTDSTRFASPNLAIVPSESDAHRRSIPETTLA